MLRKSLSSIYNINNIGFSDLNKFNQSNSLYYTNLRKAINIPSQNKNNNFKANVLNYNYGNSIHKVHLDNMLNQLKDKISEMNNNNYNIPYKNYNYGNNAQIKKLPQFIIIIIVKIIILLIEHIMIYIKIQIIALLNL